MTAITNASDEALALKSAAELVQLYRSGRATPEQAMAATLTRTERINPLLNALFYIRADDVMEEAAAATRRWKAGTPLSALDGVPISLKDSIAATGMPYWRGCAAFKGRAYPTEDSPPAARMREAGALLFAKATMPDFGMFGAGVSSAHGVTHNPWKLSCNTGGSTSGGAAAVAACLGAGTVGSDIGGSVRLPAHFCGLFSIKVSNGRVPHLPPSNVRVAGPLARTVADGAAMLTIMCRPDARDHTALPPPNIDYASSLARDLSGLRIGLATQAGFGAATDPEIVATVERAAAWLEARGASIEIIPRLLDHDPMAAAARTLSMRAATEYFALPPDKQSLVHPEAAAECERMREVSALAYSANCESIEVAARQIANLVQRYDYVLTPVSSTVAFAAEQTAPQDPFYSHATFTMMVNQSRGPAAVICAGLARGGTPIGVQVLGRTFDDLGTMQIAKVIEDARDFNLKWPDPSQPLSTAETTAATNMEVL